MLRRFTLFVLVLLVLAAPAVAQEDGMGEEPLFVSVTFVDIKPGMEAAFMAAAADHREWHAATGDTHYYSASETITGPRTGQLVFSAGPMTAEQLNDYDAFRDEDYADLAMRGALAYVENVETMVINTMPGLGNPPPPGYVAKLTHVWELKVDLGANEQFMEGLRRMDAAQNAVEDDGYAAWTSMVSGGEFGSYWLVIWEDGWSGPDPEREQQVVEAAGGPEAYGEIMQMLTSSVTSISTASYRPLPHLSYPPPM